MNPSDQAWQKLVAAARRAPEDPATSAPYGFATRVAARAFATPTVPARALLEKFALRGLFAAGAFSVAAVAFGYTEFTSAAGQDSDLSAMDPVAELLDVS